MTSYQIPSLIADRISPQAKQLLETVHQFVTNECLPADTIFQHQLPTDPSSRFLTTHPPIIDSLKAKAKKLGLWNLFLSQTHYKEGVALTNLEYALIAELLGHSFVASEAMNCSAPDTGNMELLAKYGTPQQKQQWLQPLLNGEIRSAFAMTEPNVASSDATNISLEMKRQGDHYILNGTKWWASGAGDPRCKLYLVMGKTDLHNSNPPHKRHSVIIVPASTPGITVKRALTVYGYDDAPHGHCEITFTNVQIPTTNLILSEGHGFQIIQGRLGPGRIHHCMRTIGLAELALKHLISRTNNPLRKTFHHNLLSSHGTILDRIAKSRIEIDAARFLVLSAADMIDKSDAKGAMKQIAMAKAVVPSMALRVIDWAVQAHGAAGICQDFPLARMWAGVRTLRIADGPDEVHLFQLGRMENKRAGEIEEMFERVRARREELMVEWKVGGGGRGGIKANL